MVKVKSSVRYQKIVEIEIPMDITMQIPAFHNKFKESVKQYLDTNQYATYHANDEFGHRFIIQTYVEDSDIHDFIDAIENLAETAE